MPNIGLPELLIILLVALLLFGGSRLAGLGKGVGRSIREFKEDEKAADLERRQRELEAREQALKEAELKAREAALNAREAETGN